MDLEKETDNLVKELNKIKDKHGVGVTHAAGCEFRAKSKEEYDRIIEES